MQEQVSLGKSPTASDKFITPGVELVSKLSFSHIVEILTIDAPLARFFYETECISSMFSYAQDEMGYSDEDIDTIFDRDPSAYWNID